MKKQIQHYLLLLLLLLPLGIQAQKQFPIYVTPTLTPPYSLNLSEYANFGSQKLMVIMQVNDLDIQNYPVKLHIKLETAGVTIETSPTIATTPIYLDGGATTMLFGEDLADYFNIDNLTFKGCSKQDYLRTGQLPEGFYRITVEALHYTKMVPISNAGIASAWMVVGKPPVLRKPRNAAELGQLPGSALTFSWLSSNVGNPTAAGNIQYTFEMWELRIPGINPNSVTVMAPFYEETTYATMLPVYPAILSLEPGMDYAWRVTASDASGMVPFEQEGHSELRTFTYSSRCDAASSLTAKKIGSSGTFRWDSEPNHTSYNVEMKNPNTGWSHEGVTYQEKAEFHDLTPGSVYELRVQSVCNSDPNSTSDFTDWVTLTIPESKPLYDSVSCPNCGCGDVTDAPELTNFTLRDDLQPGDTIINQRGTTRFIIKSVDNEGGTTYTGEFLFWAEIWGLKFICEYWDLQVNTDNVIVGMDFESVYDPQFLLDVDAAVDAVDELLGAVDVLTDSDIKDTLSYDGEMTSVYVDKAGNVMAVSEAYPDGKVIAKASDNENTLITNADGEAFVVSRDGEVMGVAEYQASGGGKSSKIKANNAEKEKDLSSQTVTFAASEGQKYGFDSYDDSKINIQSQYLPLQNGYRPAYKSVPSYSTDVVTASTYDDIIFKDEMGIPPMQSSNGLTIRGGADGAEVALYAYVDSTQVAGKLKIKSYDQDDNKVHIVSINGAELPSQGDLTKELNRIYGQAVVTWQVNPITLSETVEYDDDNVFNHGGTSDLVVYNKDQKTVVTAFKDAGHTIDQDAYYLFFIKDVEDKERNIGGYMPLSYQIGFIYGEPNNSTIAHELGHGAFSLWHTFSGDPVINATEGNTQNLMDYNLENPTELWSYQWDLIHDPQNMLFAFMQDEEEGAMVSGKTDAKIVFSKLEDIDMGNCYGYDDMGTTENPDDDHISVKNGSGYTYVKVEVDGKISGKKAKNFDSIFFVSTNPLVIGFDTIGISKAGKEYNLKFIGNGISSDTATIQARIKSDSTLLGQIHVNAYKEISISQTITYISPTGAASPISQGSISSSAKKYLQYLVASGIFTVTNIPTNIDINGNGRIDDFKNTTGKDELNNLQDELTKYTASDLLLIDGSIYDNWEIGDTVHIGDTSIQLPNAYTSTLTSYVNNYTSPLVLQNPDGKNQETFIIKAINGTRLDISTNLTDPTKTEGFKFQHPITHIITDNINVTAGFASTDPTKGAVVTMQKTDELTIQVIVHESMHKYDGSILFDIDKEGNLMHWVSSHEQTRTEVKVVGSTRYTTTIKEYVPIPITIPFNYSPVEQVKTGDGAPIGVFKSQWNDVKR